MTHYFAFILHFFAVFFFRAQLLSPFNPRYLFCMVPFYPLFRPSSLSVPFSSLCRPPPLHHVTVTLSCHCYTLMSLLHSHVTATLSCHCYTLMSLLHSHVHSPVTLRSQLAHSARIHERVSQQKLHITNCFHVIIRRSW